MEDLTAALVVADREHDLPRLQALGEDLHDAVEREQAFHQQAQTLTCGIAHAHRQGDYQHQAQ